MFFRFAAAVLLVSSLACGAYAQDQGELPAFDPLANTQGDALAHAIDSGSVAAVRRLLDAGTSPNTLVYKAPALMWAVWEEKYYVANLLLQRGADVNRPDETGYTPLMAACDMENTKLVRLLVEKGADINAVELTYGMSALQNACAVGSDDIFDLLVEHQADVEHVDKYGGNCLEEAAFYGHKSIADKLQNLGLKTEWPLHVAAGLGDKDEVEKRLAAGGDANQPNQGWQNTPLLFALGGGQKDIAKLLIDSGASLDTKNVLGAGPLHIAASAGRPKVVEWLLEQGLDVNTPDEEGSTPLDWAADEPVMKVLEANGGEYGELDFEGE